MTDKEKTVVDGVDVSGCRYYSAEHKLDFSNCGHICEGTECKYKRLWYKKQLKRKEQECEELKEEQDEIKKFLGISHKTIMQRLEELHERSDKYKDRILELEQECEELKKELNGSEKWRIKAESLNEKLELNNGRYRKALEEIEGIAKNFGSYAAWQEQRINKILDIINKAKGRSE